VPVMAGAFPWRRRRLYNQRAPVKPVAKKPQAWDPCRRSRSRPRSTYYWSPRSTKVRRRLPSARWRSVWQGGASPDCSLARLRGPAA
jgi:hypothetical protein